MGVFILALFSIIVTTRVYVGDQVYLVGVCVCRCECRCVCVCACRCERMYVCMCVGVFILALFSIIVTTRVYVGDQVYLSVCRCGEVWGSM